MTARGTPSRFLTSVLHNGLGRYVQQLQRLSFSLSRDAPSSRGAREFVEREVADFARQNPGVVIYVNARPCHVPRVVAEYLNGAVREESLNAKSVEEITALVKKLASQSGLDIIRIRKPFHTDSPSIQGQWHPFTNKPTTQGGLRPGEAQDPAPAQPLPHRHPHLPLLDTGRRLSAAARQSPPPCQPEPTRATRATRWLLRL
uniref:Large ribosomal subunit protein mL43 n=1 Tax=Pipistrellus kuhlii TaxID=59472 RepID=A0A7J7VBR6_PIPKU|nr:mitochondrial ribosomal protein L43 [Pipistrellus kuhlii]